MTRMKALALLSGGLDSILATKLIVDQGIDVVAFNVTSPFCLCKKGGCGAVEAAKQLGVELKIVYAGLEYLKIVRNPKHGYGRNMNPCIDCRIFLLRKAKKIAKELGASFIFTGEVLDERPMSQHYPALKLIEEEAGLKGKILRPLSARLLPETEIEKRGMVDRAKLLEIRGRSRKPQIKLAAEFNIKDYPCPAGGCLLTDKEFAIRIRDLFGHRKRFGLGEVNLLKLGRHFRLGENKIIVGRNEAENKKMAVGKSRYDYFFEVPVIAGPITVLQGRKTRKAIAIAAALTAFYSDAKNDKVTIKFGRERLDRSITVQVPTREEVEKLRV